MEGGEIVKVKVLNIGSFEVIFNADAVTEDVWTAVQEAAAGCEGVLRVTGTQGQVRDALPEEIEVLQRNGVIPG
jgi:hypothetical protein